MADTSGEPFPLEELIARAPDSARDTFVERSAAIEAGDLVRAMRDNAGLTQAALASKISTSQSHISEIERGLGLQGPTFSLLRKVAVACYAELTVDLTSQSFSRAVHEMDWIRRRTVGDALEVGPDDAPSALIAAYDKAVAALRAATLIRLLGADGAQLYRYAKWLGQAPVS